MIEVKTTEPTKGIRNAESKISTHPGEFILDEIQMLGTSVEQLAKKFAIEFDELNDIVNARRPITYEIALMCEATLSTPADFLMQMQSEYERQRVRRNQSFMEKLSNLGKIAAAL